jgi:hypothetical protein
MTLCVPALTMRSGERATFTGFTRGCEDLTMPHRSWTEADTATLKRLHADGKTLGGIATETGWAAGTISRRASRLGLKWADRMPTATERAQRENNDRLREDVLQGMWEVAQGLLGRLTGAEFFDLVRGEGGSEVMMKLPHIPSRSARELAGAIQGLTSSAAKIEAARAGQQDGSDLRVFLTYMRGGEDSAQLDNSGGDHAHSSDERVHSEPGGTADQLPPRPADPGA